MDTQDSVPDSLISVHQDSDEDGEEGITLAEVIEQIKRAWQSESASPCLLPHKTELVGFVIDQIDGMEENLQKIKDKGQLKVSLHRMELHRLIYLTNYYLRCRLQKIEKNANFVLQQNEERERLNKEPLLDEKEKEFATRFSSAHDALIHKMFFQHLPSTIGKVPLNRKNLEIERVFACVTEDNVEDVAVPDMSDATSEMVVGLPANSVHLIPFLSIQDHLENGKLRLL